MIRLRSGSWRSSQSGFVGNECTAFSPDGDIQKSVNEQIIGAARELDIPLLLTLDAHFVRPESKFLQDILLQNGNPDGWRFHDAYYQMTTEQAWELWQDSGMARDHSDAFRDGVEGNHHLAARAEGIEMQKRLRLPNIDWMPVDIVNSAASHREAMKNWTARLITSLGRIDFSDPVYKARLRREIAVIADNEVCDFLPYFLFLEEVCRIARESGNAPGPGRGSAAGCLLAYALGIVQRDPIREGLSFERFLSIGRLRRGKFPDIDLDFADAGAVAALLKERLGDRIVRICTTGTVKLKGALRDVSRILLNTKNDPAMSTLVNQICETVGVIPQGISDTLKWLDGWEDNTGVHQGELERNPVLGGFFRDHPEVERAVRGLLDVPRSIGRHASAYVVSDEPVGEVIPICVVNEEECTQFTMKPVEALGLIKIDLLGLNTLKDIRGCVELIKRDLDIDLNPDILPEDNQRTWAQFAAGENATVFQFGSAIGTWLSREIQPRSVAELAQMTSAGRPGTMDSLMPDGETRLIDEWIRRMKGRDTVLPEGVARYPGLHPDVDGILAETMGICLYQEQISAMFVAACGYDEERADEIREIVGKKQLDEMARILPEIRERLAERGWTEEIIVSFVSLCTAAANYSFNKSHANCYSYLGYVCQYLKANYPLEWWTSVLRNSSIKDLKKNAEYCHDFVSPPDLNLSDTDFFIANTDENKIIYPLRMIKGVASAADAIVQARGNEPFLSMEDFYERVPKRLINKRVVHALVWVGAMDNLSGLHGADIREIRNSLWADYLRLRSESRDYEERDQFDVLGLQSELMPFGSPDLSDYIAEVSDCHSPAEARSLFESIPAPIRAGYNAPVFEFAGIVTTARRHMTKNGKPMMFIDITGADANLSLLVFEEAIRTIPSTQMAALLKGGAVVRARGRLSQKDSKISLIANSVTLLNQTQIPEIDET